MPRTRPRILGLNFPNTTSLRLRFMEKWWEFYPNYYHKLHRDNEALEYRMLRAFWLNAHKNKTIRSRYTTILIAIREAP